MDNRQATHRHIFRGQLARYQHATTIDVRRWWILLLLGVTLSACQSVSPAKTSNIVLVQSTAPESMPDTKWWQQFDDPVLHQLIERTASNNMEINLAVTRLQQAQAGMNASHARLWPTVSIGGGLSDSKSDLPTAVKQGKPDTNARQISADLKWELDVFGSNRAAANAAAAEVQAASWGISGTQLLVISEVVRQYMTWQGATERLRLLDELIYNQQQTLQRTQSLRKEGMSSDFDLSRVQAEISHTQALLPPLHTLRAISQHRLSVLLGENPAAPSFVLTAKPINTWPTLQALPRQQQSELLKRRPDIRVAEQQLRASSAALASAKADRFPKFFANVVWGEQKLRLNGLQLATSPYQQVAMAFSAPILNRGQINANIEVKTAQEQQALLKYDQVILQAIEQVENSLVAAQQEMQRTQALIASRNQRQNALKHAHSLYREGQTGVLPVLDVERGFLSAELSLVDSQLQNTFNVIQLYTAMGGGWDQLPLPHQLAPSTVSTSSHIGASTP